MEAAGCAEKPEAGFLDVPEEIPRQSCAIVHVFRGVDLASSPNEFRFSLRIVKQRKGGKGRG